MQIVSFENDVPGFFAFAQSARGVIAFGQMAVGVVAVGQLAIGGIAVGQLGFGLVGAGQLGIGVYGAGGLGIGGRGIGGILKLVPTVDPPRDLPPCTTIDAIHAGWGDGWIEAELDRNAHGNAVLRVNGNELTLKIATEVLAHAYAEITMTPGSRVLGHVRRMGTAVVCDRLMHVPVALTAQPGFWGLLVARMIGLTVIASAWWLVVWTQLADIFAKLFG